jgi:N-acyl-D-aspartate/D-glutamate deacylase
MARVSAEAISAGALGFSTSRILGHQTTSGSPVPGTFASDIELLSLGRAVARAGGIFELVPGGSVGQGGFRFEESETTLRHEFDWMERLSRETGMPITYLLVEFLEDPDAFRNALRWTNEANSRGAKLVPQTAGRPGGVLMSWQTYHLFQRRPTYLKLAKLRIEDRVRELRRSEVRAAILSESNLAPDSTAIMDNLHELFAKAIDAIVPLGDPIDYEPSPEKSVAAQARLEHVDPEARIYDLMCEGGGRAMLLLPTLNYVRGNHDALYEMLTHPASIVGLGDGGAHCGVICDASTPTYMLTHWVRDRTRGPRIPLEQAVRKQTRETAHLYGLRDRGTVEVGRRADLNVIDLEGLRLKQPYAACDLPAGGQRLLQDAEGYIATIVHGVVTRDNDQDTGERPGRLVRGARSA